jgi:CheY-like chemotaxis protein
LGAAHGEKRLRSSQFFYDRIFDAMPSQRILIVDDQRDIRELLRASLEYLKLDLHIVDVPSGEEAMLVISRQKFDLLITDVRLAGMTGLELVQKVQKRNPGLKIILITGMTDSDVRQQVAEFGAEAFFYKPVDIVEFQATVVRCLEASQASPSAPLETRKTSLVDIAPPQAETLPDQLDQMRQEFNAQCVWVSDRKGEVVIRLGEMPQEFDAVAWQQAVAAASASSVEVARALQKPSPENYLYFAILEYDLHMVDLGWSHALLAATLREVGKERTAFIPAMQKWAREIMPALLRYQESDTTSQSDGVAEETDEIPLSEDDLKSLDDAFQTVTNKPVDTQELNEFWEAVVDGKGAESAVNAGSLTYDQARRLGLAPEE